MIARRAALLCLLLPGAGQAGSPLQPALLDAESYTETFTVIADLDSIYVQAQLVFSNIGVGDGKAACRLLVVPAGRNAWTRAEQVDRHGWRAHSKPVARLVVGTCQMTAASSLLVDFQLDDATVHLELTARVTAVKPPGHFVGNAADDFYSYEILVPWADATARITLPGADVIESNGRGYADHSRSTMLPADLASSWVRFRGLDAKCPTLILVRTPPNGKSEGFLWTATTGPRPFAPKVEFVNPMRLVTEDRHLKLSATEVLYRHAPLEEYALAGLVRNWIGSPETTTYRATLESADCGPSAGILEITTVAR